jgi:hypothetical protein
MLFTEKTNQDNHEPVCDSSIDNYNSICRVSGHLAKLPTIPRTAPIVMRFFTERVQQLFIIYTREFPKIQEDKFLKC